MTFGRLQVRPGMEVVGTNGNAVGRVREAHDTYFLVERSAARDLYVPYGSIRALIGDEIVLDVSADQVDAMGWWSPPVPEAAES